MKIRSVIAAAAAVCMLAAGSVTAFAEGAADASVSPEEAANYSDETNSLSDEDFVAPVENADAPAENEDAPMENEDAPAESEGAPEENVDTSDENGVENTSSDGTDTEVSVMPIAAVDDTVPANDTASLDNPDTGFESVAAVIGAVALAGAGIVMSRKKG